MKIEVTRFERLKEEYEICPKFGEVYTSLKSDPSRSVTDYILSDDYLFKGVWLCIPHTSVRDFLIWELHAGGITSHFGRNKTTTLVEDRFYRQNLKKEMTQII